MNGIYDFEMKRTPYLDVEMLLERKAKKREELMLILSCIAAGISAVVGIAILIMIAMLDEKQFIVATIIFALYIVIGVVCAGKFIRKREAELWKQLV